MGHNNPSKLAYDEVSEIYRGRVVDCPIAVMVNIGTGGAAGENDGLKSVNQTCQTTQHSQLSQLSGHHIRHLLTRMDRWKTERKKTAYDLQRLSPSERNKFKYTRLDVEYGLQHMQFDEWKTDGSTLQTIETHTTTYLNSLEVQAILADLARDLVNARIARQRFWTTEKLAVSTRMFLLTAKHL